MTIDELTALLGKCADYTPAASYVPDVLTFPFFRTHNA